MEEGSICFSLLILNLSGKLVYPVAEAFLGTRTHSFGIPILTEDGSSLGVFQDSRTRLGLRDVQPP